ncbi:MAG: transposase [Gammaproteobacteria bacterium]|nr:transposase [Gammaproteobacteria bacterium]
MTRFHSDRLRQGRYSNTNQIYLITTVTYLRRSIFNDFIAGRIIVKTMKQLHDSERITSLAFVVMADHIHWLIQLKNESLDKILHAFKGVSAKQVNQYLGTQGKLWQAGYHDHAVRKEEDLPNIARYIVANPLRAGLVNKVGDYPLWDAVWL